MENLDLIKEIKSKTLERILERHGHVTGDLTDMKLSIWDVRQILYEECRKIAKDIFIDEFGYERKFVKRDKDEEDKG